jgi:hypothetical protein
VGIARGNFPYLAASVRRLVSLLPDRPAFQHRSRERGSGLAAHIDQTVALLSTAVENVEAEYSKAETDQERERKLTKLRLYAGSALLLHRALPWVEDAVEPSLELGALYFIEEMGESLLEERADVIATRSGEYSTEQQPFSDEKAKLQDGERRTVILNFPALEDRSFPLLPLFAHELGHTVVTKYELLDTALGRAEEDEHFAAGVSLAAERLKANMEINSVRARLLVDERLRYWLTELLCDQIAIQHLGPSYLLAFVTYVGALTWDTVGAQHPPTTHRVRHLLRWVEKSGWSPVLADRMPQASDWLDAVAETKPRLPPDSGMSSLIDALHIAHPYVAGTITDHLGDNVLDVAFYIHQAEELDAQLAADVIPVQGTNGTTFDRRAIILSGWFSIYRDALAQTKTSDGSAALVGALQNAQTHQFFTKALEISRVADLWEKVE